MPGWLLLLVATLIAMVVCGALNYAIEKLAYRPLRSAPRLAPLIFVKQTPISLNPELENTMLELGHPVKVNEADDDVLHIQAHMLVAEQTLDPHGTFRDHIAQHMAQMEKKQSAVQQTEMLKGVPGSPGGAGPGVAGTPPGAQVGQPHAAKGPPGMIHPDQMAAAGAVTMPRKM